MTKRPMNHPKVVGAIQSKSRESHSVERRSFSTEPMTMLRKKKLLVISPVHYDATSWYRAAGPFSCIKSPQWDIQIVKKDTGVDWTDLMAADLVFLQRPYDTESLEVMQVLVSLKKPVWIDYDDNLFELPDTNRAHPIYSNPNTQNIIMQCMALASVVSCSTAELTSELNKKFPGKTKFAHIPNAWNDIVHPWQKKEFKDHKRFFWRGSHTHKKDVNVHLDSIRQVAAEFPDWEWFFCGDLDLRYMLEPIIPQDKLTICDSLQMVRYFNFIKVLEVTVSIVPLQNNLFNKSKSNIAWQECTMGGSAVVAPDWAEWQAGNMAHYSFDSEVPNTDFVSACIDAVQNAELLYNDSWKYIQENLLLSQVNRTRLSIMNGLT